MCFASQRRSLGFQTRVTGRACLGVPRRFLHSFAGLAEKGKANGHSKVFSGWEKRNLFCRTEKAFVDYRIGPASHRLTVSFNVFGTEELKEPPIQELKSSHMLFAFVVALGFRMVCLSYSKYGVM